MFCCVVCVSFIYFRAVKVNTLFYEIIVAEINAIKYLNALHDFSRKLTRPVREKVTNALAVWVAGDCRTINIVKDVGLTEVIRIASGDNSYDLPLRGTIVSRIHSLYDGERAQK